jgi:hypothetical protein
LLSGAALPDVLIVFLASFTNFLSVGWFFCLSFSLTHRLTLVILGEAQLEGLDISALS